MATRPGCIFPSRQWTEPNGSDESHRLTVDSQAPLWLKPGLNKRTGVATPARSLPLDEHYISLALDSGWKTDHLPGRPDLIFPTARVAIFCDGDFWHGRDWETLQVALRRRANPDYWIAKIGYNRRRDIEVTQRLTEAGWRVMRLWEGEIVCDPAEAAQRVKRFVYPVAG